MIIYGSRASHLGSEQLTHEKCPQCNTEGSVTMSLFGRYAHIFWIPAFPIGKKAVSQCQNCKQVLESKDMPQNFKNAMAGLKSKSRTPLWHFAGLVIITALVAWGYLENKKDKEEELAFLQSPQVNDVYTYKTETNNYTTFKIAEISADSIIFYHNMYETNKSSGIRKIDLPENYEEVPSIISKSEVNDMYSRGKITDIERE